MKPLLFLFLSTVALHAFAADNDNKKNYTHRLQLADRVRVAIYQEEDLTSLVRIDARGMVNLPLIAEVKLGGLTLTEAQETIRNTYREQRYLRDPQVTVSVEEYAPREVSVMGQVRGPGRFVLPTESTFTVVEVITKAGGITDVGNGKKVSVTRIKADGAKEVFTVDVESVIKGKKSSGKIEDDTLMLLPGDIVYVPESII